MHIEQELKAIVEGLELRYVHLIDDYGLNTMLPQLTSEGKAFVVNYVSAGSAFEINQYDRRRETAQIQMVLGDIVPFVGEDGRIDEAEAIEIEADHVETISETMKERIHKIIDAINASGKFEKVKNYRTRTIPLRYDAYCTCVSLTFELAELEGTCV